MPRRVLIAGIVVVSLGVEIGLLVINRFVLSAGVYKFPYPIAATLVQCFITFCLIGLVEQLGHFALPFVTSKVQVAAPNSDQESLLPSFGDAGSDSTKSSRDPSPQRHDLQKHESNTRLWDLIRLTFVYVSRIALSNINVTQLPLSIYTICRLGAVPLVFVFNSRLNGDSHSKLAVGSSFLGTFSLALTVLFSAKESVIGDVLLAIPLPILDALLPILLLDVCFERSAASRPKASNSEVHDKAAVAIEQGQRLQGSSRKCLFTLRQVSLLSCMSLLPIFFFCGELQDIRRNSYVLDVIRMWVLLISSGVINALSLGVLSLVASNTTPVTATFITVPSSSIIIIIFGSSLTAYGWTSIGVCWFSSICFLWLQLRDTATTLKTTARSTYSLLRTIFIFSVLFGCFYSLVQFYDGEFTLSHPSPSTCQPYNGLDANPGPPEAPRPLGIAKDDYLGPRPDVNTIANISLLVERCPEIANGTGVDDIVNCLNYLRGNEHEYLSVPSINPTKNASNPISSSAQAASATSIGTCPRDIIPFHVYWTGPATWRLELFVKAYLYTQDLPCSRLWIWVDEDIHPGAVDGMLCSDPIFARFLPLVQRGDINIRPWTFPTHILIPNEAISENTTGLYNTPQPSPNENETFISSELILDADNNTYIALPQTLSSITPVQISDAVRFIVLHQHGGIYLDMDVLLLRDMRPLLLSSQPFAEQWVERCTPSAYNTAVISLPRFSTLSSFLLLGGVRMGMNFHPLVLGRMLWREDRNSELAMLHNAVFDPLVTNLRRRGSDVCTVPCHKNFKSAFMRVVEEPEFEWSNYHGPRVEDVNETWPPTNRTMANFFRGAWAYHIHNQWHTLPEPTSWMDVITRAQDGFFEGTRTNAYGEVWDGPFIKNYNREHWQ